MSTAWQSAPLGTHSLSEADQKIRLRKRQQIEQHWRCPIDQILPQAIRPRSTAGRRFVKAKVGEQIAEAEWWRWSNEFFYKLENLAAMTPGKLPFAQALMQTAVTRRQHDYTNQYRESAELLNSDLVRIIAELKERITGGDDTGEEEGEDDSDVEGKDLSREGSHSDASSQASKQDEGDAADRLVLFDNSESIIKTEDDTDDRPIKQEPDCDPLKRKATDATIPAAKRYSHGSSASPPAAKEFLESRANIASLRAAAARLRQQACQREAKAFKLEAELYEREAGEVE